MPARCHRIDTRLTPCTPPPRRLHWPSALVCSRAGGSGSGGAGRPAPSPLAPFWRELRLQVGRLEGLRGLSAPISLRERVALDPPITVRAGAFHSDRLRLGRFIYLNAGADGEIAVLRGALHPTLFSRHPPLLFDIAALGAAGWVVAFDCPLLFPDDPSPHEQRVQAKLQAIVTQHAALAVPLPPAFLQSQRWMSPAAGMLASTQLAPDTDAAAALCGPALHAFRAALTAHLDLLVMAPLDGSAVGVAPVASAHRGLAEWLSQQEYLGRELLEGSFGAAWCRRVQAEVLNDARGLPAGRPLQPGLVDVYEDAVQGRGRDLVQDRLRETDPEFLYFDPRLPEA